MRIHLLILAVSLSLTAATPIPRQQKAQAAPPPAFAGPTIEHPHRHVGPGSNQQQGTGWKKSVRNSGGVPTIRLENGHISGESLEELEHLKESHITKEDSFNEARQEEITRSQLAYIHLIHDLAKGDEDLIEEDSKAAKLFMDSIGKTMEDAEAAANGLSGNNRKRFVVSYEDMRWDKCIIPYQWDEDFSGGKKDVTNAMAFIENNSGIRFVKYKDNVPELYNLTHNNRLNFVADAGCYSSIGNVGEEGQDISCCSGTFCVHELGHAIGFMHEQTSPLRKDHIRVNFDGIITRMFDQFSRAHIEDSMTFGYYDMTTIMHYLTSYFNVNYMETMTSLDPDLHYLLDIDENYYYFFSEIEKSHNCSDQYCADNKPVCENDGFVSVVQDQCVCICPEGLDPNTGCTSLINSCGGIFELSDKDPYYEILSPSGEDPRAYPNNEDCIFFFKAPEGTTIQVDFLNFDVDCSDYVEIRNNLPGQPGTRFCGDGFESSIDSNFNHLAVSFHSDDNVTGEGFHAVVQLVTDAENCYTQNGRDHSYVGKVNYTRSQQTCLKWSEVPECRFNRFSNGELDDELDNNYCRNAGVGTAPWCYTNAETCAREYCDACGNNRCYDRFDDCAELIANDDKYCEINLDGEAYRGCRKSCNKCVAPLPTGSSVICLPPGPINHAIGPFPSKSAYTLGEQVEYRCSYSNDTRNRTCNSDGTWSELGFVCGACPRGWAHIDGKCFIWLDETLRSHDDAVSLCESYKSGATLVMPKSIQQTQLMLQIIAVDIEDTRFTWIGLNKLGDTYVWADGSPLNWTNWKDGPNGKDCVFSHYDGQWIGSKCKFERSVVCEYQPGPRLQCKDQVSNCDDLIEATPSLCVNHTEFAWANCPLSCGMCGEGSSQAGRTTQRSDAQSGCDGSKCTESVISTSPTTGSVTPPTSSGTTASVSTASRATRPTTSPTTGSVTPPTSSVKTASVSTASRAKRPTTSPTTGSVTPPTSSVTTASVSTASRATRPTTSPTTGSVTPPTSSVKTASVSNVSRATRPTTSPTTGSVAPPTSSVTTASVSTASRATRPTTSPTTGSVTPPTSSVTTASGSTASRATRPTTSPTTGSVTPPTSSVTTASVSTASRATEPTTSPTTGSVTPPTSSVTTVSVSTASRATRPTTSPTTGSVTPPTSSVTTASVSTASRATRPTTSPTTGSVTPPTSSVTTASVSTASRATRPTTSPTTGSVTPPTSSGTTASASTASRATEPTTSPTTGSVTPPTSSVTTASVSTASRATEPTTSPTTGSVTPPTSSVTTASVSTASRATRPTTSPTTGSVTPPTRSVTTASVSTASRATSPTTSPTTGSVTPPASSVKTASVSTASRATRPTTSPTTGSVTPPTGSGTTASVSTASRATRPTTSPTTGSVTPPTSSVTTASVSTASRATSPTTGSVTPPTSSVTTASGSTASRATRPTTSPTTGSVTSPTSIVTTASMSTASRATNPTTSPTTGSITPPTSSVTTVSVSTASRATRPTTSPTTGSVTPPTSSVTTDSVSTASRATRPTTSPTTGSVTPPTSSGTTASASTASRATEPTTSPTTGSVTPPTSSVTTASVSTASRATEPTTSPTTGSITPPTRSVTTASVTTASRVTNTTTSPTTGSVTPPTSSVTTASVTTASRATNPTTSPTTGSVTPPTGSVTTASGSTASRATRPTTSPTTGSVTPPTSSVTTASVSTASGATRPTTSPTTGSVTPPTSSVTTASGSTVSRETGPTTSPTTGSVTPPTSSVTTAPRSTVSRATGPTTSPTTGSVTPPTVSTAPGSSTSPTTGSATPPTSSVSTVSITTTGTSTTTTQTTSTSTESTSTTTTSTTSSTTTEATTTPVTPKHCLNPGIPLNASVTYGENATEIKTGQVFGYQCSAGYSLAEGDLLRACLKSGELTGRPPVCKESSSVVEPVNSVNIRRRDWVPTGGYTYLSVNEHFRIEKAGNISMWKFYSSLNGTIALQTWRPTENEKKFVLTGQNVVYATLTDRIRTISIPADEQISVEVGDVLGIFFPLSDSGHIPYTLCSLGYQPEQGMQYRTKKKKSSETDLKLGKEYTFKADSDRCKTWSFNAFI